MYWDPPTASLIPPPPVGPLLGDSSLSQDSLLPPFLHINSKITYEQDGQYHKGYLTKWDGTYCFSFELHVNKRSKDWGVNLPNLPMNWIDLCIKGLLIPGHISHTFLRSLLSPTPTTFDPVASFVSAVNLHLKCLPSLLKGLADSHPDQEIWLNSFYEEKQGIERLGTFSKTTLGEHRALCKKGAPKAIPTMCILSIKHDKNLLSLCAKSCIVILGNHKDRIWSSATGMLLCFRVTPSGFWLLWLCQSVVCSAKATTKTPSARVSYRKTKSLSSGLHLATPKRNQMSISFSSTHSLVFVRVPIIGMTK